MGTKPATPAEPGREADQRLELAIATLLRVGVLAAAALVVLGGVLSMRHPGAHAPSYAQFHAPAATTPSTRPALHSMASISGVFHDLRHPSGITIVELGLLILIATPIARVAFAAAGFAAERDWVYVAVSLLVLAILVFSILHGT